MIKFFAVIDNKLIVQTDNNDKKIYQINDDDKIFLKTLYTKDNNNNIENEIKTLIETKTKTINDTYKINEIIKRFPDDFEKTEYNKLLMYPFNTILTDYFINKLFDSMNGKNNFTPNSLINFYRLLLNNNIKDDIFKWFQSGNFSITENGFIIAYRDVDLKEKQSELFDFVSSKISEYVLNSKKIKNKYVVQNFKTYKYKIVKESNLDYDETKYVIIGSLFDTYQSELSKIDKKLYTDQYTHTMKIKLMNEVSIPRNECDSNPYNSCSKGLHGKSFNYGSHFGNISLVMLVAPYDIVAVPIDEPKKFRCCAYLPICKVPKDENGNIIPFEEGSHNLQIFEGYLINKTNKYLKENINKINFSEEYNIENISKLLSDRIVTINK